MSTSTPAQAKDSQRDVLESFIGQNPSSLTFGVEFEFSLQGLLEFQPDPQPRDGRVAQFIESASEDDTMFYTPTELEHLGELEWLPGPETLQERRAWWHITRTLREAGLKAINALEAHRWDNKTLALAEKEAREQGKDLNWSSVEDTAKHEYWHVGRDGSVAGDEYLVHTCGYEHIPLEISSPAFELNWASILEVQKVCNILSSTYKVNCNTSAGLHVHIGNGALGFSNEVVGNLIAVLWTFEPQIQYLHSESRRSDNSYCETPRTKSMLVGVGGHNAASEKDASGDQEQVNSAWKGLDSYGPQGRSWNEWQESGGSGSFNLESTELDDEVKTEPEPENSTWKGPDTWGPNGLSWIEWQENGESGSSDPEGGDYGLGEAEPETPVVDDDKVAAAVNANTSNNEEAGSSSTEGPKVWDPPPASWGGWPAGPNINIPIVEVEPVSPVVGLELVLNTPEVNDLVSLMSCPGKGAYNMRSLYNPYSHAYKRTVEFRQHESTLDPERVAMWISVCAGLVDYARKAERKQLESFLKTYIDAGDTLSIVEVLVMLGMPWEAVYYGKRLQKHDQPGHLVEENQKGPDFCEIESYFEGLSGDEAR